MELRSAIAAALVSGMVLGAAIALAVKQGEGTAAPAVIEHDDAGSAQSAGRVDSYAVSARHAPTMSNAFVPTPEPTEVESEIAKKRTMALHEVRWSRDPMGGAASSAVDRILSAAASPGVISARFLPNQLDAQCRSTMCRIETRFPPGSDGNQWAVRLLLSLAGQVGSTTIVRDRLASGDQTLVLYTYRPGVVPPS